MFETIEDAVGLLVTAQNLLVEPVKEKVLLTTKGQDPHGCKASQRDHC